MIQVVRQPISFEAFQFLCSSVGWGGVEAEHYASAVDKSLACVHASFNGEVVGYGRLVGDGGLYIYIQDLIVDPTYQGQGIGNLLLEELHKCVREMKSSRRRVVLIAESGVQGFYEKAGYLESIPVSKILKKTM